MCPRAGTHEISDLKAELSDIVSTLHILIQHDLHSIEVTDCAVQVLVHMRGCVDKLDCALKDIALAAVDIDVLGLGVAGLKASDIGESEPAVTFDFRNHSSEGVGMCGKEYCSVLSLLSPKVHENRALVCQLGLESKSIEGVKNPCGRLFGEA